jgi:sulfoxide reductase heme-binding subunit YedZ
MTPPMTRKNRNLLLLALSVVLMTGAAFVLPYATPWERISVASAWLGLVLIGAALLIGPLRLLDGREPPLNIHFRRDLGIWGALLGLLHFVAGNVVAMNQTYIGAFVSGAVAPPGMAAREQLFNWGSIFGTVVGLLFVLLLAISSDAALRRLGPKTWKRLQRSSLVAFWLTAAHGVAFQILEDRYMAMLLLIVASVAVMGFRLRARLLIARTAVPH